MKQVLFLLAISFAYVSCDNEKKESGDGKTGKFIDSPVINIGYRTQTHNGFTDSEGRYDYEEGETVTFFICDLELPPVLASGYVTPFDIAGDVDLSNPVAINIARFLQTIDADSNPGNGITIPAGICAAAQPVNFSLSVVEFENSTAVLETLQFPGSTNAQLKDEEESMEHLLEQYFGVARLFEIYGTGAGNYALDTSGTLIGTSADMPYHLDFNDTYVSFTVNVSGYSRFVLHIPASSQQMQLDAIRFDNNGWLESTDGDEFIHRSDNFNPTNQNCSWNSASGACPYNDAWMVQQGVAFDGYAEGEPDGITLSNRSGEPAFYGYSTKNITLDQFAGTMTLYFKL